MASTSKFRWCDQTKSDLYSIVSADKEGKQNNWLNIERKFKQLHPRFEGTINSLKTKYRQTTSTDIGNSYTSQNQKFRWSDQSKTDLIDIINDFNDGKPYKWPSIVEKFKQKHPEFNGTTQALRVQYNLLKKINNKNNFDSDIANEIDLAETNTAFNWTKTSSLTLTYLVNLINVDGQPNWRKIWRTFQNHYPNYMGNQEEIRCQYLKICNDESINCLSAKADGECNKWDDSMDMLLVQAIGHAQHIKDCQIRDGRKKIVDLAQLTVKQFKDFYKKKNGKDYINIDAIILKHFYEYKELNFPSSYVCEEDIDSMSNIEHKKLQAHASKNHTLAFSKVFNECCHNCGFIFPRNRNSTNRKMLPQAVNGSPQVVKMKYTVPYKYLKDEKYITCLECFRKPNWQNEYKLKLKLEDECKIPEELINLSEYESNQIALCGGFYTLYKKKDTHRKIFEHRQGECNIGKRLDKEYHQMFTTFYNIDRPMKQDLSSEKIKAALRWLKRNNTLYKDFLSHYETIYGFLMSCRNIRPEESIIQISKGNLNDIVGKDTMGILIPADNVKIESALTSSSHKFGVQHPMQLEEKLNSLKGIINVTYSDPHLEAKRWPHLFPEGIGSWKKTSILKPQTYVKHRLLGIDPRFRKNNEFMFFWYDRLIKERLLYYNNRSRTVNVAELMQSLQVKEVRENESRFGSVVPSSIPGSRTYWKARCLDLLALVRDLGKPDLFVTLTQNDNWIELQEACGNILASDVGILDNPIMQPAIGGKNVVDFPVETVVAFYKRLEMFMQSCIHNKNGPFGEVIDYWYRIEYQNRGALHCHMVLWICEETIPENIVMAEMPRYNGKNEILKTQTYVAREYVKMFQIHNCISRCRKDKTLKCKYGFPYGIQQYEEVKESKMGYTYMRRSEEDKNVVPYNIYALLIWNGHINVQKVTSNGIEAYLCKYVSKPEKSIDIKNLNSDTERFLKARVVGILECCAHLLQFHQVGASRKTLFLPCDFQPANRMLKRKNHLPDDNKSEDVYYQTLLHKYLVRPKELHNLTYMDMFKFYDVVSSNARSIHTQTVEELSQDESENEIQHKCDESQHEFSCRVRNIKSQRKCYIRHGYKYSERGKAAVPRWRFLMPFGNESEKYYEQRLLLHIPITEEELNEDGYPFSEENKSSTFVEECCIRGLIDSEETAKSALIGAVQRGFSVERVIEIATLLVDQSFVTKEYVDSIIIPWVETMPCIDEEQEADDEFAEDLAKMFERRVDYEPYDTFLHSMTESQQNCMEWVDQKIKNEDQILAIISGGAGVGKSYITKALYSYFVEKKMVCILLATTGSAAHLISGTTVHYYLKLDIHGNRYLQTGTISAKIVEDTDVIIVDEFSMLNSDLLDQLNDCTKEFGKSKQSAFGGKHVFLIGDPCQLPAINQSVFSNSLLNVFSILLLKETVRQKDLSFSSLLNRVRVNKMTDEDKQVLRQRYIEKSKIVLDDESLIVTAKRKEMQEFNKRFIDALPGDPVTIQANDFESDTNKEVSLAVKGNIRTYVTKLWDEKLILKEGCIVRLLRNLDVASGWVNSKRAKVFRVAKDGSYIVLQDIKESTKQLPLTKIRQPFKIGANLYYRLQYPLILGYATTIHSVQGTTVTGNYYVNLNKSIWESGQAFVALSRPKHLSQLFLLDTSFDKVILKPYYEDLLKWMIEVDEIAIIRKPRLFGDFPLLPITSETNSKMQVFPDFQIEEKHHVKKNPQFKPPRALSKTKTKPFHNADPTIQKRLCSVNTTSNVVSFSVHARMYKLAEAFNNTYINKRTVVDKIRFGKRFMNELLEELNATLGIRSIIDPVLVKESGGQVSEDYIVKWDEQKQSTVNLFRKYTCQFAAEFELFVNLILECKICNYAGQILDANFDNYFYRDNQKWLPVHTNGDGRCFYHSLSFNIIGDSSLSNSLKILLAYVITRDFDIFESICFDLGTTPPNLILKVLSYSCWADYEIINSMAFALQRPIYVVTGLVCNQRLLVTKYNRLQSENDPIYIGFVNLSNSNLEPNHFIALLRDESYIPSAEIPTSVQSNFDQENIATITIPDDDVDMDSYDSLEESL